MPEEIFKDDEIKSVIRIINGIIKRVRWCSFEDKKKIFAAVLRRSDMSEHIKAQMLLNVEQTEDEKDFFRYLRNSQNFYERRMRIMKKRKNKHKFPTS